MIWTFRAKGLKDTLSSVKFGMKHPWADRLRLRKNQLEGLCEGLVWAINWPLFGHFWQRGATGYTQQYEIWHGESLATLIKTQEQPIRKTI